MMFTWVGGASEQEQWNAYIEAGKQVDPDLDITFSGPAIGDYYTKLPTELSGSNAPCIITLQNGQVPPYADALEPLGPFAAEAGVSIDDYDASMISQLSVDGEVYALPYDAQPNVVFYNKAIFDEAGVAYPQQGWTTQDFIDTAKATTGDGVYGFAVGQGLGPISIFANANGESYVSEDGVADLLSPVFLDRFQMLVDLATVHGAARPLEATGANFPDIDAFSSGQAAMFINGTWDLPHQQDEIGADNLGVATIPTDDGSASMGSIGGSGFAVTQTCADKEAAFTAIAAMTSAEAQQTVARSRSAVPARADALEAWGESVGEEAARVVLELTSNGATSPTPRNQNELNTLFTQYQVEAFSGASTVEEVARQVMDATDR